MLNERQIRDKIYELKKEIKTLNSVLSDNSKIKPFGRPKRSYKYSLEQIDFLKDCKKKKLEPKEIIKQFNTKFGTEFDKNTRALYNFMSRSKIISPTYTPRRFTEEEDKYIMDNVNLLSKEKIADKLNRTKDTIKNRINLLYKKGELKNENNNKK